MFIFWENSWHHRLLSRFTDLYKRAYCPNIYTVGVWEDRIWPIFPTPPPNSLFTLKPWHARWCQTLHYGAFWQKSCPVKIYWNILLLVSNSHLICPLISENEGLEKSRAASNLKKISVPAHLNFFFSLSPEFFSDLYHRSEKNSGDKLKKNSGVQELKFF